MATGCKAGRNALPVTILTIVTALVLTVTADARTVPVYSYTGTYYDGTGSTAGPLGYAADADMNQAASTGVVTDPGALGGSVSQFDAEGGPLAFSALGGETSIPMNVEGAYRVAVDNSSSVSQGNFYVLTGGIIKGFRADGTELGDGFPLGGFQRICDIATDPQGDVWVVDYPRYKFVEFSTQGVLTGKTIPFKPFTTGLYNGACSLAIDSNDNFYFVSYGLVDPGIPVEYGKKYDPEGHELFDFAGTATSTQNITVDLSDDHVFTLESKPFEGGSSPMVIEYDENGEALTSFGFPDPVHSFAGLESPQAVAVAPSEDRVYVADSRDHSGTKHVEIFEKTGQAVVPTVKTEPPALAPTEATLTGTVDLDGAGDTTDCHFEWGSYGSYGEVAPCTPGGPITGSGVHQVTAQLTGLTHGALYHYRLVAESGNGIQAIGRDRPFRPQGPLTMSDTIVSGVNTDGALLSADINPNGGETDYFVEYGLEDCDLGSCTSAPLQAAELPNALGVQAASVRLSGLAPDTGYHYRLIARNDFGEVVGMEDVFRTYAADSTADSCPNALSRKETRTVLLPDCRAYELVSSGNTGGYDVRSDLVPGQSPLMAKPRATDRLLYSLDFGKIPGVGGEPTNFGTDPYVATRTATGWTTSYAGIAVGDPPYQDPFGSTPLEESEDLSAFIFGGPDICDPCFADGTTGIPVRRNGGPLTQGMAGDLDPGPAAEPDGFIGRPLSGDGTHLIFGSTSAFEQDAAGSDDVTIYDRNLVTGTTHVVSKTPAGANLTCLQGTGNCHAPGNPDGIGSLDVSHDGSRIVVAQLISIDSAGRRYWHPYMNVGDSSSTVDLAPGTTTGVLYAGMTSDGSSVLYTTKDNLTADDHDASADVYRADVDSEGDVVVTRVSTGSGAGDTDGCDPSPGGGGNNWNAPGASSPNGCGAVAFAGGNGVARGSGAIYFLSPEKLDASSGIQNEPNLYVSKKGSAPHYVATLEPSNPSIEQAVNDGDARGFEGIQVAASGDFAAFSSSRPLVDFPTFGHMAIYRYAAEEDSLSCASCPSTRASLTADTELSQHGLDLTDDGRVFFTSFEPLALRDTGSSADVYEWKDGRIYLISTGRSQTDTRLLSASADGQNAFFFTRETLVSDDHNGNAVKIYSAHEGGGFQTPAALQECQASDECHGPGSAAPPREVLPTSNPAGRRTAPATKRKRRKCRSRRDRGKRHCRHGRGRKRSGNSKRSRSRGY
jgi:hypothetical protein